MNNHDFVSFNFLKLKYARAGWVPNNLVQGTTRSVRVADQRCSAKKGVLRNFAKFRRKHLRQSPFFNKVAGHRQQLY